MNSFRFPDHDGTPRQYRAAPRTTPPHPLGNIQPEPQRTEADLLAALGLPAAPQQPGDVPAGLSKVCDFCERAPEQHPPAWYYPTKSTLASELGGVEVLFDLGPLLGNGWVACNECHGYLDRGDFAGLADFLGYAQLEHSAVDQFRKAQLGPGQRLRGSGG
ncbi:hypothetical protein [Amycolatopsis kentuckyensis]|uniref:hypothetical protein n=1 Tax=Amycolatopsis kentuckyensis TaxID=218823 RepID=UPI0035699BA1